MDASLENFTDLLGKLPSITREGLLVHALRMPTSAQSLLLPRQLAYYYQQIPKPEAGAENAKPSGYVCGVSGRNLLPEVNFCQDIRAWRARLERAGVKVVKAASFSGRSIRDHIRYARKIGYPVVLKPVIRNTLFEEYIKDIKNDAELEFLFRQSRELKKQKASDLSASPYAMTRLSEDHIDEHGRKFLPLSVRYMVEKQQEGEQLRLIVAFGKVVAALTKPAGAKQWQQSDDIHESYEAVGRKVAKVLQGMDFLRVDLIVDNPTEPANNDNYVVIALSEHLKCYKLISDHFDAAQAILEQVAECKMPDLSTEATIHVELSGVSNGQRLKQELGDVASVLALTLKLDELDEVTGRVHFELSGPTWALASLTWIYANGLGINEVPTSVTVS
ncbi:hypothetical protein [Halomonas sp. AOP43-D1-4]|uniref:hypothetical protein n=1 Tax=Halomonas sp. AOP43-D1-4 TaxID=3457658 RepID=UPI0040334A06